MFHLHVAEMKLKHRLSVLSDTLGLCPWFSLQGSCLLLPGPFPYMFFSWNISACDSGSLPYDQAKHTWVQHTVIISHDWQQQ